MYARVNKYSRGGVPTSTFFIKIIQISAISGFYVYLLPCGKSERNDQNDDEKIKLIVYMPIIYSVVHLCHAPLYACY